MSEAPADSSSFLASLPQRLASSTPTSQNRIVSEPGAAVSTPRVKQAKRRWSDQNRVDRMSEKETEALSGEGNLPPSPSQESYSNTSGDSEESDFDTYPYPLNVHRASDNGTEVAELQFDIPYQATVAQTWPWYHYGLYYGMPAGPYTLNTVTNNQPLGAYYPETPSNSFEEAASEPKESDSTIAPGILTQEESHTTGMGENHFAATELIDRYQVVEVFKQIVSLLPSVFDKPDAPALSPIPLTKRVLTAVKFHRMLPDKFPCPLHGSSGRRGEKVFFHPGPTAIQWFGYGRQHALVIGVRTQDHPTLGFRLEGTFKDLYNQKREMFHVQKNNLYYAGTYRCLRIEQMITIPEIIESLDLSLIDKPFKADLIKAAMQAQRHRTPNDPSLRLDRMTELCLDGTIKFEWVAFQCVGFDEDVFRALGGRYVGPSVPIVEYVQKLLRESTNVLNADQSEPQLSEQDTDASIEVDEVYA